MTTDIDTSYRVLVVDDEPSNIRVLHNILHGEYAVSGASSGEDALRLATELRPDIILLDMAMPGMDGIETCKRLKADERTRNLPVIFVTAMGDEQKEMEGLDAGAVDYIRKPVTPAIVQMRVKVHLQNSLYVLFLEQLLQQRSSDLSKAQESARALLDKSARALIDKSQDL